MARLRDAVDAARGRIFVGRRNELDQVARWLANAAAPTRVISVRGMGGIGKSTLLAEVLRVAGAAGAVTLWMDGRASTRYPAGFLDYLETVQARPPAPQDRTPVGAAARFTAWVDAGRRVVLEIDNFDDLAVLEGWLREDFLGNLPERGILVILASRQGISPVWLADPAWRDRIIQWSLGPFDREESREYLAHLHLDASAAEALIREAQGHPLALALGAERLAQPSEPGSGLSQAISAHLLLEVAAPDLHPALEVLAILREGDQELLARVLGEPLTADRYHALSRLSFINLSPTGLALHDVARVHLLADLERRAPSRFRLLRRRALAALRDRLAAAADRRQRRHVSALLLALCRDALPAQDRVADMTVISDLPTPTPPVPEERPLLHRFLDLWAEQAMGLTDVEDDHRLLDALLDRFPESIWVGRTAAGRPFGFFATLLLHRESAALLERHRAGALYLKRCPPAERRALDIPPEKADTYFGVLAGFDASRVPYEREEVVGALLQDFLALAGEGTRLLVVVGNPDMQVFIRRLGFRLRPDCRAALGDAPWPFQVAELDLRGRDFGEWVATFLEAVEGAVPSEGATSPRRPVRQPGRTPAPADPALLDDLRTALAAIDQPNALHDSSLARRLGLDGPALRRLLWDLLTREVPPPPLSEEDQAVLRVAYLEGVAAPETAAARLHLSRATYYRHLRAALAALAVTIERGTTSWGAT